MGVVYQRLSRTRSRRHTVVFSNYAVIRRIRNKLHFMIQAKELLRYHLVDPHVRMYAIQQFDLVDVQDVPDNTLLEGKN